MTITNSKDINLLNEIEELIIKTENEIQKSMALMKFDTGTDPFKDVFNNIDLINEKFISLDEDITRLIAITKVSELINSLEENIALIDN